MKLSLSLEEVKVVLGALKKLPGNPVAVKVVEKLEKRLKDLEPYPPLPYGLDEW